MVLDLIQLFLFRVRFLCLVDCTHVLYVLLVSRPTVLVCVLPVSSTGCCELVATTEGSV